jgi:hypothetical protein
MACSYCDKEERGGGVSTNFDPYGTRRKLKLLVEEWQSICWPCWEKEGAEKDARIRAETTQAVLDRGLCGFEEAWVGHCFNTKECPRHKKQRCWSCKGPATRNCSVAGSLVCGVPECAEHPHEHKRKEGRE